MKKTVIGILIGLSIGAIAWAVTITRDDKSINIDGIYISANGVGRVEYVVYPTGHPEFAYRGFAEVDIPNKSAILAACVAAIKAKEDIP